MVKRIGKYNVEYAGLAYENDKPFQLIRICEFDKKDRCVADKHFYVSGNKSPDIETEEDVRTITEFPSGSKIII